MNAIRKFVLFFVPFVSGLCSAATYYVDSTNGDDGKVGSADEPFATLAAALAKADVTEVVLAKGTYAPSATATLNTPVTVRGATGKPEDVILKAGKNLQLMTFKASGCGLYDLTMDAFDTSGPNGASARLLVSSVDCVVSNCIFRNVKRGDYGSNGAVNLSAKGALITHCVLTNNHVTSSAYQNVYGCLMLDKGATASNCLIANNSVDKAGTGSVGGVYAANGKLVNCTIVNNTGVHCGGVRCVTGSVVNCVIADNKSTDNGVNYGNIWLGTDSLFSNCASDACNDNSDESLRGIQGTDCQYSDDKSTFFSDYAKGDFSPAAGSALTDHGKAIENPPAKDLAGLDRVMGGGIDIGAYEMDTSKLGVKVNVSAQKAFVPATIAFTAETSGVQEGDEVSYEWTFGDGQSQTTAIPSVSHVYATAGDYTAVLVLKRGTEQVSSQVDFHFVPERMYVKGKNAGSAFPFDAEGNAAATVGDALAVAIPGNVIELFPGTITETKAVSVKTAVTIRGATGRPEDVIVKPNSSFFLMNLSAVGAVLSGVTLQGSGSDFGQNGDGMLLAIDSYGTATNCIFRNITGTGYGTHGAVYVKGAGALVTHCVISNVSVSGSHTEHYAGACVTSGARMSNCLVVDNHFTGANAGCVAGVRVDGDSKLVNCTVVGNVGKLCGGVRCVSGSVVNCAIVGNAAENNGADYANIWKGDDARFFNCASDVKAIAGTDCRFNADKNAIFVGYADGNFAPASGSILRENGKDVNDVPELDLAGNPRIQGEKIDIGAFEADLAKLEVKLNASTVENFAPIAITFEAVADAADDTCTYEWDFGDGATDTTAESTVTHLYALACNYTARVKLVKGTEEVEDSLALHLVPRIMRVKGGNLNAAVPYDTVDNAASNVAQALEAAIPQCVIEVEPGLVNEKVALRVDKSVTIRGRTGDPSDVVVSGADGGNSYNWYFDLADSKASFESLTLRSLSSHRLARIDVQGGTFSNCVVTGPSYEIAIKNMATNGLVTHCVISNSYLDGIGGGGEAWKGIYIATAKGRISNTLITGCSVSGNDNSAIITARGQVDHCTVVGNDVRRKGGLALQFQPGATAEEVVRDSIFAANTVNGAPALHIKLNSATALRCFGDFETNGIAKVASAEELFRNPSKGDWRLRWNSPARDIVPKSELPADLPATDLGGNPRVYGVGLDAGCYECRSGGMMLLVR